MLSKITVFSNSWIALAAAASTLLTYLLYDVSITFAPIAVLFFSTWARYNIISFTLPNSVTGEKFLFMKKHRTLLKAIVIVSILITLYFAWQLSFSQLLYLSHLAFLTLWYIFPLPLGVKTLKPLRKLPFLKIFLITYVWASATFVMPLLHEAVVDLGFFFAFLERFLFLFAITLPFDIKDYKDDKRLNLSTIPNTYGIQITKILATSSLLICLILAYLLYPFPHFIGLACSYAITWPFIWFSNPKRSDLYYLGWIDGTMIWQVMLTYASILIWK